MPRAVKIFKPFPLFGPHFAGDLGGIGNICKHKEIKGPSGEIGMSILDSSMNSSYLSTRSADAICITPLLKPKISSLLRKKFLWRVEDRRSDRVKETTRISVHDRSFRRGYPIGCFTLESYFLRHPSRRCLFPSFVPAWLYPLSHLEDQHSTIACLFAPMEGIAT